MKNKIAVSLLKLRLSVCFCSCLFCLFCIQLQAAQSNEIDIFVNTEKSFLWRTAESSSPVVSWETPSTAVSASLAVNSLKGKSTYDVFGVSEFILQLETPDSAAAENVYDLTLTFNCGESNVVRRGQIGVVRGIGDTGAAGTEVDIRPGDDKWSLLNSRKAVLPVPAGSGTLTIDGTVNHTMLGGAAGWYGWRVAESKPDREPYQLSLEMPDGGWLADVIFISRGFSLILR